MEKLNPKNMSLSLAATSGILSAACALLIAVAPQFTVNLFGNIFHGIDLTKIQKTITFSGNPDLSNIRVSFFAQDILDKIKFSRKKLFFASFGPPARWV